MFLLLEGDLVYLILVFEQKSRLFHLNMKQHCSFWKKHHDLGIVALGKILDINLFAANFWREF